MVTRDRLSEFVSRRGRVKLVRLLLHSGWSATELARALGITRQAIYLWLKPRETHPCNLNLDQLLDLALNANRVKAVEILRRELEIFQKLLSEKCQVGTLQS